MQAICIAYVHVIGGETGQAAAGVASACGRLRQIDQCRQQASTIFEQLASEQYIEIDSVQRSEAGLKTKRHFGQAKKRHYCRRCLEIFVIKHSDESLKGIKSEERRVGKTVVRKSR